MAGHKHSYHVDRQYRDPSTREIVTVWKCSCGDSYETRD